MVAVHAVLSLLGVVVAGLHLVRLTRPGLRAARGGRVLEGCYAAMALGMAAMFAPVPDPVPFPVWVGVFLLSGGWAAATLLARSPAVLGGEARHVLVASLAMLFMLGVDRLTGAAERDGMDDGMAAMPGMAGGHAAHAPGAPGLSGVASAVTLVLAGYFVLHTLRCADRWRAVRSAAPPPGPAPAAGPGGTATLVPAPTLRCTTKPSALAHLAMTVAMAMMLVGMM